MSGNLIKIIHLYKLLYTNKHDNIQNFTRTAPDPKAYLIQYSSRGEEGKI